MHLLQQLCIRTIRVENGLLTEITDLFLEMMTGVGMGSSNIVEKYVLFLGQE